jgi:HlyD family secretion protein
VDPGNAVAASLQAVTLFTVAEDLHALQLSVNVDEADVGQVRKGQDARFTVSAWPGRQYPAQIVRVAYGSTTTDNVVTYTTLMDVPNADLTLRPGITATSVITATEHKDVLLVPARALRFTPTLPTPPGGEAGPPAGGGAPGGAAPGGGAPGGAPGGGSSGGNSILSKLMPRPPGMGAPRRSASGTDKSGGSAGGAKRLWVLQDGHPVPIEVTTGLSNGRLTEVSGNGLREGLAVITDQVGGATR